MLVTTDASFWIDSNMQECHECLFSVKALNRYVPGLLVIMILSAIYSSSHLASQ